MQGANLIIKKGAIWVYRIYDIAHEINLKKAQELLDQANANVRRFQLKKDPLRTIIMREAPLMFSGGEDTIKIKLKDEEKNFKSNVEIKIWDYGAISFSFRLDLVEDYLLKDLVLLGSILESNSEIEDLVKKKKEEISKQIVDALKLPFSHTLFEDYTTYLIEDIEEHTKGPDNEPIINKFKDPKDVVKKGSISELLLAEPNKILSDSTRKTIQSNQSQYTNKDLLIVDWNSALVIDFTKEKEYQDYVDILEFSITQLLELRIYDQLLDEKLDDLYNSMERKEYNKLGDFYSALSEEAGQLYIEFSDFFEKIDNSIKTVGDFYLAKVLKTADKKLGFEDLKNSMARKIDTLNKICKMLQDKVDSLIDEKRNKLAEKNNQTSHRMEIIVILLIVLEVVPTIKDYMPVIKSTFSTMKNFIESLF
jgi:hypothetical protein